MARLSARDNQRASEVVDAIAQLGEAGPAVIDRALPLVRELLETQVTSGYALKRSADGSVEVDYVKSSGLPTASHMFHALSNGYLQRVADRRGLFDPLVPQRRQRNKVLALPFSRWCKGDGPDDVAARLTPAATQLGLKGDQIPRTAETMWELESCLREIELRAFDQLRILLCDGDTLLTWLGALQPEPFSEQQRLLLKRVAEPLRQQLIVERRAAAGGLGHAAMVAALEHIPAAAFVLDANGRVTHANAVGRHRLEVQGSAIRLALLQAVQDEAGARPELVVSKITGAGMPPLYLVINNSREDRVRYGIERARTRWQLTAREVDVLAELAAGRSNREIAEKLNAAPRTVEIHVSSILRKAYADSRSQLIIDLWHLADAA